MRNFSRSYAFFIDIDNNIWYYISAINEYILRKVGRMIKVEIRESKKLNDSYSAYVSFKYDSKIVTELRALPFKFYNASNQEWEIPITKLDSFVKKLNEFEFTFCGDLSKLKLEEKQVELPEGFEFKTKPFAHQLEGVEYGLTHDNWFLGDEQGLGKTKQIIDIAVARKLIYGYKHCLIVCGVNTLKWNWVNEILTHSNEYAYILGQKATRDGKIKIGSMSDKLKDLTIIENDKDCIQPYFIITNIESFRDKNFADTIKKLCDKGIINMCAMDEFHKCFDYDTLICTDIGDLKIGDIVKNKIKCNVLSYNETTNKLEYKPILNWYENFVNKPLLELTFEINGEVETIKCTEDHLFFTKNRGWITAKQLDADDELLTF